MLKSGETLAQPESFKGSLRPYQLKGLQWLAFLDRFPKQAYMSAVEHWRARAGGWPR